MSFAMTPQDFLLEVMNAERVERAKRGLPQHHVLDLNEFPFAFSNERLAQLDALTAALLKSNPNHKQAAMYRVYSALSRRDYSTANDAMQLYAALAPNDPQSHMRFPETPHVSQLDIPPLYGDRPESPAIFLPCDPNYYRLLCVPLLHSIAESSPGIAVHVHIIGSQEQVKPNLPLSITISYERAEEFIGKYNIRPAFYYGAVRMIRFAELLESAPLILVDVDALVTGNIASMIASDELALRVRPARFEPWNQYSACCLRGGPSSLPYFRLTADIVRARLHNIWWGLDQYALFSASLAITQDIVLLGPEATSVEVDSPGLFWFTAGKAKTELMSADTPYARMFRHYAALSN